MSATKPNNKCHRVIAGSEHNTRRKRFFIKTSTVIWYKKISQSKLCDWYFLFTQKHRAHKKNIFFPSLLFSISNGGIKTYTIIVYIVEFALSKFEL